MAHLQWMTSSSRMVLGKSFWVNRKPNSVPTIVTREFSSKVRRGLTREWTQVLDMVWAVPWASMVAILLMMTRPIPSSGVDGASYTALPANDGEERAMVETAIVEFVVRDY